MVPVVLGEKVFIYLKLSYEENNRLTELNTDKHFYNPFISSISTFFWTQLHANTKLTSMLTFPSAEKSFELNYLSFLSFIHQQFLFCDDFIAWINRHSPAYPHTKKENKSLNAKDKGTSRDTESYSFSNTPSAWFWFQFVWKKSNRKTTCYPLSNIRYVSYPFCVQIQKA